MWQSEKEERERNNQAHDKEIHNMKEMIDDL